MNAYTKSALKWAAEHGTNGLDLAQFLNKVWFVTCPQVALALAAVATQ